MSNYVPSGEIYLLKNVDIDNSYNHQYYFTSVTEQNTFFSDTTKQVAHFTDSTYQRKNSNALTLHCNADSIREAKYLRWKNQDTTKWYYAFITSIDYENPNTSIIHYQLDVYQTYLFDIQWKPCFIDRMHCQRWRLTYTNQLSPVLDDVPEDLEYGDSYEVISTKYLDPHPGIYFAVLASNKNVSQGDSGSKYAPNLEYYIVPIFHPTDNTSGGALFVYGNAQLSPLASILYFFKNDTSYVNSLVSVYYTKYAPGSFLFDYTRLSSGYIDIDNISPFTITTLGPHNVLRANSNNIIKWLAGSQYNFNFTYTQFPEYTNPNEHESKLLEFPYTFLELTNNRGESKILKLQDYLSNDNRGRIFYFGIFSALSPNHVSGVIPFDYLGSGFDYNKLDFNNVLYDTSDTSMPINDDYCASYLQSNSNSIKVAQANAQLYYDTARLNAQRTHDTELANMKITGGSKIGNILISGLGGIANILAGNAVGAINSVENMFTGGLSTTDILKQQNTSDTNLANAQADAYASYHSTVESTLAKVRDAEQIPPSTKNPVESTSLYLANSIFGFSVRIKTIKETYKERLTSYFRMYGYKVNKMVDPNNTTHGSIVYSPVFSSRLNYNYVKMSQVNISGNIPDDDLKAIRGIFTTGVTLWHGASIGNYNVNNKDIREPDFSLLETKEQDNE